MTIIYVDAFILWCSKEEKTATNRKGKFSHPFYNFHPTSLSFCFKTWRYFLRARTNFFKGFKLSRAIMKRFQLAATPSLSNSFKLSMPRSQKTLRCSFALTIKDSRKDRLCENRWSCRKAFNIYLVNKNNLSLG